MDGEKKGNLLKQFTQRIYTIYKFKKNVNLLDATISKIGLW